MIDLKESPTAAESPKTKAQVNFQGKDLLDSNIKEEKGKGQNNHQLHTIFQAGIHPVKTDAGLNEKEEEEAYQRKDKKPWLKIKNLIKGSI